MQRFLAMLFLLPAMAINAKPIWYETSKPAQKDAQFQIVKRASGIKDGWGLAVLPDQRLLLTSRKKADIWLADPNTNSIEHLIEVDKTYTGGQGGLLGIWVDTQFAEHPFVYVAKSVESKGKNTTELLRYRFVEHKLTDETLIFNAVPLVDNSGHFGGAITQDEQGALYLSIGDRRQQNKAQSVDNHLGKIVKMDRNGKPVDAPVSEKALPEIFSYGHRNPQGLVYVEGKLWSAEHGPQGGDEVNIVEYKKNYGWPVITYGEQYGGGKIGEGTERKGMEQPLWYYVPSIATSDLSVQRIDDELFIFVASLKGGVISQLQFNGKNWQEKQRLFGDLKERWRSIESDGVGGFYLLAESGNLYQVSLQ